MNYYDEQMEKIKFYEIEYIDVNTINDYIFLEKRLINCWLILIKKNV